jgi:hypothetical protein
VAVAVLGGDLASTAEAVLRARFTLCQGVPIQRYSGLALGSNICCIHTRNREASSHAFPAEL